MYSSVFIFALQAPISRAWGKVCGWGFPSPAHWGSGDRRELLSRVPASAANEYLAHFRVSHRQAVAEGTRKPSCR